MFVLNVDLWNADGSREVNLVRSSAASSAAAPASAVAPGFVPRNAADQASSMQPLPGRDTPYAQQHPSAYPPEYAGQSYHQGILLFNSAVIHRQLIHMTANNAYRPGGTYAPPTQHYPQHQGYRHDQPMPMLNNGHHSRNPSVSEHGPEQGAMSRTSGSGSQPQGMFTRNLIGSVAVSAFNLCDAEEKRGIWFVLQDLSVRTEGNFR